LYAIAQYSIGAFQFADVIVHSLAFLFIVISYVLMFVFLFRHRKQKIQSDNKNMEDRKTQIRLCIQGIALFCSHTHKIVYNFRRSIRTINIANTGATFGYQFIYNFLFTNSAKVSGFSSRVCSNVNRTNNDINF
jgi:hypothetical protein